VGVEILLARTLSTSAVHVHVTHSQSRYS
jgi:hypothetical protein